MQLKWIHYWTENFPPSSQTNTFNALSPSFFVFILIFPTYQRWPLTFNIFTKSACISFEVLSQNCEERLFISLRLCLCPHVTTRPLLIEFSWTFMSEDFTRVCVGKIQDSLQSDKNNGYFTWKTSVRLWSYLAKYFVEWEIFQTKVV